MILFKGDCLEELNNVPSGSVDMILTDPPYGTTQCKWDSIIPFNHMWEQLNRIIKPNGAIVLFGSEPFSSALRMSNIKNYKYDWVWVKNLKTGNLNAKKMPMGGHELIHVFYSKPPTYRPQKRKRTIEKPHGNTRNSKTSVYGKQSEVAVNNADGWINPDTVLTQFKCVHSSQGRIHSNQKPVDLMEYLIKTYTNEGETVADFTMGSGTTGVACIKQNRKFIGIEKDEKYFAIAEKRINESRQKIELFNA